MIMWKILSMESQQESGIVISAKWLCSGENNGVSFSMTGNCIFPTPVEPFTLYDALTEEQVLSWCWIDGGIDKTLIEESISKAISPSAVKQSSLPWVS